MDANADGAFFISVFAAEVGSDVRNPLPVSSRRPPLVPVWQLPSGPSSRRKASEGLAECLAVALAGDRGERATIIVTYMILTMMTYNYITTVVARTRAHARKS